MTTTDIRARSITLSNDFHGTTVVLRPGIGGLLSAGQVRRAWKTLCGIDTCTCGDNGIRGRQVQPDGSVVDYEWVSNDAIRVTAGV